MKNIRKQNKNQLNWKEHEIEVHGDYTQLQKGTVFFSPDYFSEGLSVLLLTPPGTEEKCFSRIFALPMDADAPSEAVALMQMALSHLSNIVQSFSARLITPGKQSCNQSHMISINQISSLTPTEQFTVL